ncbi:MAG: iron-containing alcohol dehydrogenase [Ruthenibacterium lactatiformans]
MEILPLRVGVGKFFFTEGCIAFLPEEIHRLGPKALMIGGPNSMPALIEHLPDGWNSGLEIIREVYAGACSVNQAYAFAEQAMTEGCSVVVGVGGGRCIDLAKAVSVIAGIDIITVPTSLATCAASSAICVMYHDDGRADHSINMKKEVDVCIADPRVLTTAPKRLLASGVMDSMAKLVEIMHQKPISSYKSCFLNHYIGLKNAEVIDEILRGEGVSAYHDSANIKLTENITLINLLLTSIVSGFCFGATQMALAHGMYDGIRKYYTEEASAFLHGEIVAVGILIQMAYNDCSKDEIAAVKNMMKDMDMPITLTDIGLPPATTDFSALLTYMYDTCNITEEKEKMTIKELLTTQ